MRDKRFDVEGLVGERVEQSGFPANPEDRANLRPGRVRIDQQHRDVPLVRHAERQIDADEGLAIARQSTGDQNEPHISAAGEGLLDEWAFDLAKMIREAALQPFLGQVPCVAQSPEINRDALRGPCWRSDRRASVHGAGRRSRLPGATQFLQRGLYEAHELTGCFSAVLLML